MLNVPNLVLALAAMSSSPFSVDAQFKPVLGHAEAANPNKARDGTSDMVPIGTIEEQLSSCKAEMLTKEAKCSLISMERNQYEEKYLSLQAALLVDAMEKEKENPKHSGEMYAAEVLPEHQNYAAKMLAAGEDYALLSAERNLYKAENLALKSKSDRQAKEIMSLKAELEAIKSKNLGTEAFARKIAEANLQAEMVPAISKTDRPHLLSAIGSWDMTDWQAMSDFVFSTCQTDIANGLMSEAIGNIFDVVENHSNTEIKSHVCNVNHTMSSLVPLMRDMAYCNNTMADPCSNGVTILYFGLADVLTDEAGFLGSGETCNSIMDIGLPRVRNVTATHDTTLMSAEESMNALGRHGVIVLIVLDLYYGILA